MGEKQYHRNCCRVTNNSSDLALRPSMLERCLRRTDLEEQAFQV